MRELPGPIVTYLENLELELKKIVGVSPEDALCDVREHLFRELEEVRREQPGLAEDAAHECLVERFGDPKVVAQQYAPAEAPKSRIPGHAPGWRICCTRCGRGAPAGKVGITRIGAYGKKYTVGTCSGCGGFRWMKIVKDLDKATLTKKLGVDTTPQQLRASAHRPWTTVAGILVLVGATLFAAKLLGAFEARAVEPAFENLPAEWKLVRSQRIGKKQTEEIAAKFGVQMEGLSNSVLRDEHGELQINVCRCATERDAMRLHKAFADMHQNPRDCIWNGRLVYEFVPRKGDVRRLYAQARYRLGLVPDEVRYRVTFRAAPIADGDYMQWNKLFNLFLAKDGGSDVDAQIAATAEAFKFGTTFRLRSVEYEGSTHSRASWGTQPQGVQTVDSLGAVQFAFASMPERAGIQFVDVEGVVNSKTLGRVRTSRANNESLVASTKFWPVDDPQVVQLADKITGSAKSDREKVDRILAWFMDAENIRYDGATGSRYGVAKVLQQRFGHCWDYSDLFVTLCRASRVPCRQVLGWLHESEGHVWAEAIVDGHWQQFDPTIGTGVGSDYVPITHTEDGAMQLLYVSNVTTEAIVRD